MKPKPTPTPARKLAEAIAADLVVALNENPIRYVPPTGLWTHGYWHEDALARRIERHLKKKARRK